MGEIQDETRRAEGRLLLPSGLPGINEFATDQWWSRHAGQLRRRGIARGSTNAGLPMDVLRWTAEPPSWGVEDRTVLLLRPLLDVVRGGDGTAESVMDEWAERVISVARACAGSVVHAVAIADAAVDLDTVLAAAGGHQWPLPESGQTPHGFPHADEFIACFDEVSATSGNAATLRVTRHDVLASLAAAYTDAPDASSSDDDLRTRSVAAVNRIRAAGVHLLGVEERLLWPARDDGHGIGVDPMARALVTALREAGEWCEFPPDPTEPHVLRVREELSNYATTAKTRRVRAQLGQADGLARLSARRLLRMLVTARSRW